MSKAALIEDRVQPKELPNLSPSSINLYLVDPALWVLKHFYKQTSGFNIYAMRGVAVENGLNHWVKTLHENESIDVQAVTKEAVDIALTYFQENSFYWDDEDLKIKIEADIEPWVKNAIKALLEVSEEVPKQQVVILTEIEGLKVGGFLDYDYEELQTDLKTVNNLPKIVSRGDRKGFLPKDKQGNVRQQAIYKLATGKETSLLYVTPTESLNHIISDAEAEEAMIEVKRACKEIKTLLELPIEEIIDRTPPNWKTMEHSFYWDEPLRRLAHDLWWFHTE